MVLKVLSMYDSKAAAFLQPVFELSRGTALRNLLNQVERVNPQTGEKHPFAKNPADYTLFEIAEYDDSKGVFNLPKNGPFPLGTMLELLSSPASSEGSNGALPLGRAVL